MTHGRRWHHGRYPRLESLLDLDSLLTTKTSSSGPWSASSASSGCARTSPSGSTQARCRSASSPVEIGKLGLLGMHLKGYGCGGTTATAYGLVCQELEAVDCGLRSLVSVQGSLAMFAIHQLGQRGTARAVAAGDGGGRR